MPEPAPVIATTLSLIFIAQNFASTLVSLNDNEMESISTLERNHRYISGDAWVFEGGSYTLENIFG